MARASGLCNKKISLKFPPSSTEHCCLNSFSKNTKLFTYTTIKRSKPNTKQCQELARENCFVWWENKIQLESSSNRQKEALISQEFVSHLRRKSNIGSSKMSLSLPTRKFHCENYKTCTHHINNIDFTDWSQKRKAGIESEWKLWKLVRAAAFHFQCSDNLNARGRHTQHPANCSH